MLTAESGHYRTMAIGAQPGMSPIDSRRVLVVDDRPDASRVAAKYLEQAGASVAIATNGLEAIELIQREQSSGQPFDAVIMDLQMPVMTGQEAIIQLRREGNELAIIVVSADAVHGRREECIQAGCDEFLRKPIDRYQFLTAVARSIEKRRD